MKYLTSKMEINKELTIMNVDEKTDTAAWPEGKDFMVSTILEWES